MSVRTRRDKAPDAPAAHVDSLLLTVAVQVGERRVEGIKGDDGSGDIVDDRAESGIDGTGRTSIEAKAKR